MAALLAAVRVPHRASTAVADDSKLPACSSKHLRSLADRRRPGLTSVRRFLVTAAASTTVNATAATVAPPLAAPPRQTGRAYPPLQLLAAPGVRLDVLSEEPPVYVARNVLSAEACEAIIGAAEGEELTEVSYDQEISVNLDRLRLLLPMVVLAAVPPVHSAFQSGLGVAECAEVGLAALGASVLGMAALTLVVRAAVEASIGGKVFMGTKWDAYSGGSELALQAVGRAMRQIELLTGRSRAAFERPLVTRYRKGDRQRRHFDARVRGDAELADFKASGGLGQRLVQCVVYLNDVPVGCGGETRFLHPDLQDLKVRPTRGDCLIFFPAFADGEADMRMEHAGEPVLEGLKYILNTWVCENEMQRGRD